MHAFAWAAPVLALVLVGCATAPAPVTTTLPPDFYFTGYHRLKMVGTLELPPGAGRFPAVLLLPGSGPTDRDGNQPGLQIDILREIADKLKSDGIASLRFDKRAVRSYAGQWPHSTGELDDFFSWEALVGDATAAYDALKAQPEVDPKRLAILGHSEGGLLALEVAKSRQPKALVLVSTAGRDLGTVIEEQISQGYSAQFSTPADLKENIAETDRIVNVIRKTGKVPADVPFGLASVFPGYLNRYLHSTFTLNPVDDAKLYTGPTLVVQGQKDIQVSAERDAPRLKAALKNGELYLVPNGTHCMKTYVGSTDPGFSGPVIPAVLSKVSGWLGKKLGA